MFSLVYFEVASRKFFGTASGGNWKPPPLAAEQSWTVGTRFIKRVGDSWVEDFPDVRGLVASIGYADKQPESGAFRLQVGEGAPTDDNTSAPISWNETQVSLEQKLNAIAGLATPIKVNQAVNCWEIRAEDGTPIQWTVRDNGLFPISFAQISEYQVDGEYVYELRLIQSLYAITNTFARKNPPAPALSLKAAGGEVAGTKFNTIQQLTLPAEFRGMYYIRDPRRSVRTGFLSHEDTPATIAAAINAALDEGEEAVVTLPISGTAYIEFTGSLAGTDVELFELVVAEAPPGDVTFTLDLGRPELRVALRGGALDKVPFQASFWIAEPGAEPEDEGEKCTSVEYATKLTRPLAGNGLAAAAGIDWLQHPSLPYYPPFLPGQIIHGARSYADVFGNGSATSIPVPHNLGTPNISSVEVWVNAEGGRKLRDSEYLVVRTSDNALTLDFSTGGFGAPEEDGIRVIVEAAGPASAFQAHEHTIGQVEGLQDILDGFGEDIQALLDAQASIGPVAVTTQAAGITVMLPETREVLFYKGDARDVFNFAVQTPVARGTVKASDEKVFEENLIFNAAALPSPAPYLLPAVHSNTVSDVTAVPAASAGSVWKNDAAPILTVGGGLTGSQKVRQNEFMASDGRIVYAATRSETSTSYYPRAFERELWRTYIDDEMLTVGRTLDAQWGLVVQLINATSNAQWVLVVQKGTAPQDTTPATPGPNLQNIVWDATPLLTYRLILTPLQETRSFGIRIKRSIVASVDTLTLDVMKNGNWLGNNAAAPSSANFALRAYLGSFDTENALAADARGWVAYQVIGAGGLGDDGQPTGKPKLVIP